MDDDTVENNTQKKLQGMHAASAVDIIQSLRSEEQDH
jgi:hypothetical protein